MLDYIVNHVFLPPRLPQEDDGNSKNDSILIEECKSALCLFQACLPVEERSQCDTPILMMSKMLESRDPSGDMLPKKVAILLETMKDGEMLSFHIRSQNAGLLVRKRLRKLSLESFELSPTTKAVMTTKGRLRRCFPGPAISVSRDRVADASFHRALTELLAELDVNTPEEAHPVIQKADSTSIEIRDSVHPKFVTEMLTGILRGIGQPVDVARIHKRTRDDILWNETRKPWRRSPLWLLLRVALQTSLMKVSDTPHKWYKSFIVFFMAYILDRALKASQPSDILFVMSAKISRRIHKLGIGDEEPWMAYVQKTIKETHLELTNRWRTIEQNPDPLSTQVALETSELSFSNDTELTLSKLRPYLEGITNREKTASFSGSFTPICHPRIQQCNLTFPRHDLFMEDAPGLFLADIELWVQDCLNDWLIKNRDSENTSMLLVTLIEKYTAIALSHYAENPTDMSLMMLTSIELWVALDQFETHRYGLLKNYDPGFPSSLFNPMLLPKRLQMERLARVEKYLEQRRAASVQRFSLIFQDINTANSFGVRYFDQSIHHQELRRKIEAAAELARKRKKEELKAAREQYDSLMRTSNAMSCETITRNKGDKWDTYTEHSPCCRKCQVKQRAQDMQITVHEWPLPEGELETKSVVFELHIPPAIARWRDVTYALLVDVFSPPLLTTDQENAETYRLDNYSRLRKYLQSHTRRLQLVSTARPFSQAYYGTKKIPEATEENICVNNGMYYIMYDSALKRWALNLLGRCDVQKLCTFQLPSGSYTTLQYALDRTTHTSNEVLARQAECPKALNLHEFYAFATLRAGDRLQWRNIARELVARVLNFSHEETYELVVQAAWQAGRPGEDGRLCRVSHVDLEEEEFGISLVSVLEEGLGTIEGNWQGAVALRTFATLATRLLSMTLYSRVQHDCYSFLRRAREISLQWTRDVGQLLHEGQGSEQLKMLNLRALELALTCHGTFEVDKAHLSALLLSKDDIATIIECSIIIHDRCPSWTGDLPRALKTLLKRYEKLTLFLEPVLRKMILEEPDGINSAICRVWVGYRPGGSWTALNRPSERWLVTETSSEGGYEKMIVNYNILDGSLLVNGSQLTRLPRPYELHPTYSRLFGEKILNVVPSNMTGMLFETRKELCGQEVYFRMHDSELIIRTRRDTQVLELLPIHALHDDFPKAFVQDYAHWFDIATGLIEWRPLEYAWTSSPENWQMRRDDNNSFVLIRGAKTLIDVRSATAEAISKTLSPLEHATHVHIVLNRETRVLEINLPRLKLDFHLQEHTRLLESKQFPGMAVDKCQTFGALTGLMNKLVLRDIGGSSRSVIIPHGEVSFQPSGHHIQVMIDTASAVYVKYHSYHIDSQLGRLVDNGSLRSRLFRLYLHATTAHCLIDKLTGRTGTEEALYGLAGAATRSFVHLGSVDIELLQKIALLTPRRHYYPGNLQVMQQIKWQALSPLSQHCDFYRHVLSIFKQAQLFHMFQEPPEQGLILRSCSEQDLIERAAIRDSSFQVQGFGAETYSTNYDISYASRDQLSDNIREFQTCYTAKLVDGWPKSLKVCPRLLSEIESWYNPLRGPVIGKDFALGFDHKLLDLSAKFLPGHWCTLHKILSGSKHRKDKYKIIIFLSALSYSHISVHNKDKYSTYIVVHKAVESARIHFQSRHRNCQFKKYVKRVQNILGRLNPFDVNLQGYSFSPPIDGYIHRRAYVTFEDLTMNPAPRLQASDPDYFNEWIVQNNKERTDHSKLKELLTRASSQCSSQYERRYAEDLLKSFDALCEDKSVELKPPGGLTGLLKAHLMQTRRDVDSDYQIICRQLQAGELDLIRKAKMLPRLSPTSILSHLASNNVTALPDDWKKVFVQYGLSITALQRAERLLASAENRGELLSELENRGHQGWDPMLYPDWLLLEVENNILIREEQAQICKEMMSPSSGSNSVMQLNMGLGKSSVIVPIAAAALADRTQLVRVIVLKPLAMQMFHLIAKRLGGLLNRRVFYMPISRSLKLDVSKAHQIHDLYQECMDTNGILLIQPEHILSFELMGLERLLSGHPELGNALIQTRDWLRMNSRDILDESDEILSVRFELIYSIGVQRAIEFSPDRWTIIQHVLGLLGRCADRILDRFPGGLEVVPTQPGSVPRIRILQSLAGNELLESVAQQLCEQGLPGIPVWNFPQSVRTDLFAYLTNPRLSATVTQSLQEATFGTDSMRNGLLLLKGLFAGGVIRFALEQKRWRVNYGLDPSRTMLAVPYHAKDIPSARAEFSHPDAAIVLTCLSYYYGGLSDKQIYTSFEALLQSDNAPEEYARWVKDAPELPVVFRQITGINLSNAGQCSRDVFPPLRFAKGIIDFYMSTIVFPAEMKEFTHKLSSSGWDLAREKNHYTTGFSGTNDSRYILPLSISQRDLPQQLSTNAKVLDYLLRSENSFVDVRRVSQAGILNAKTLLEMALTLDPPIRVILDVGAQVLELKNEEMARTWLSRMPESAAQAAIFFDNSNEICVLSRDGTTEPLLVSPFAKQMDQCLVYLDEAHTRGTDLKMPADYRAIVTLGPDLTKDRLVQACMRMRKLGQGQSVVLCSSMEIQRKILKASGKSQDTIEVADVLTWCMAGTCAYTRKCIPLWVTQGVRHQRQYAICLQSIFAADGVFTKNRAESLLEKEAQTLQQRYGSEERQREEWILLQNIAEEPLIGCKEQLASIRAKCKEFNMISFNTATLQEEQERELSPENEREHQVELPPALTPRKHIVHPDVKQLVTQGILKRSSEAFRPAFETLHMTKAFEYCETKAWQGDLIVTSDFAHTVQALGDQHFDFFLRPVHWVVSLMNGDAIECVVLSPYEAQELLPSIRQHKNVILHVYSPRHSAPVRTLEDLSFCAIPAAPEVWPTPAVTRKLNLFAGQLYIRTYEEYVSLCSFLGLCSQPPDDHMEVACDGFISSQNRAKPDSVMVRASPFMVSPVAFLRMLMALRRKGQSFSASHLGKILNGELISREHFT